MDISAVVATRNRGRSLFRHLKSLSLQTYPLKEVIIIDSSDDPTFSSSLCTEFPDLPIVFKKSEPSVCIQRNQGVRLARASHILLCDDDLEFPGNYLEKITDFLVQNPDVFAVSGLLIEPDTDGELRYDFESIKLRNLIWSFIFQLSVWADLSKAKTTRIGWPLLSLLRGFYRKRGNGHTLAGWPLVTEVHGPYFRTSHYSLGGAVIRKEWLLQSPFDEVLDPHGIGDNYGVSLGFPHEKPVVVSRETFILHHRSTENRLPNHLSYYRRILALHYFLTRSQKFSRINRVFLVWSLIGNFLYAVSKNYREMRRATSKAIRIILTGRNPFLLAGRNGPAKCVSPMI